MRAPCVDDFFARTPADFLSLGPADIRDAVVAATRQLSFVAAGRRLRGHRIAAARAGRPTLVLLHDALGCVRLWRDVPERLAAATGCAVVVYDRWGSGNSAPLEPPFSAQYLLDEALGALPDVLRATGSERPILVGHSDGAAIALAFAGAHPDLVRGVVAIAPHLFREPRTVAAIAEQIADFEHGDLKARLARYHGSKTDRLFRRLVEAWTGEPQRACGIEPYVGRVRCPVLAIQGTEDEFFTRAQLDALGDLVPGPIETCLLPGCGHAPHHQAGRALVTAAARFIDGLAATVEA